MSLGKPGLIDQLFTEAGFRNVATTKMAAPFRLPAVSDYMQFVRTSAGPIVEIVQRLESAKRDAAWADIESQLSRFGNRDRLGRPQRIAADCRATLAVLCLIEALASRTERSFSPLAGRSKPSVR